MDLLLGIWVASLLLATASITIMLVLVLRRAILHDISQRRHEERRRLTREILKRLDSQDGEEKVQRIVEQTSIPQMVALTEDLLLLVRGQDRERLIEFMRSVGVVDEALKQSRSRTTTRRLQAVRTLGYFQGPKIAERLRELLQHDPEPEIRLAAAEGLVENDALPPVLQLVFYLGLGRLSAPRSYHKLFRNLVPARTRELSALVMQDVPPVAKILALDALGRGGEMSALPAVMGASKSEDPQIRAVAMETLGRLSHPGAIRAITEALKDRDWTVRAAAARAAGEIGLAEASEQLRRMLSDSEWWVRYRAAEALLSLGEKGRSILDETARHATAAGRVAQAVLQEHRMSA